MNKQTTCAPLRGTGFRADASSQQVVSTEGFNPARDLLAKVLAYYEGRKPFDFYRLPEDQRADEAADAWQEIAEEIRDLLSQEQSDER